MTKKPLTAIVGIPAAGYIRMSTERQEDSPERQRKQINAYASGNGYRIVRWYEDHGISGTTSHNRPQYQQMLADASSGAFEAILVSEQSRSSREDIFAVVPQWDILRRAGVKLVSCLRGVIDFSSMGGFITAFVDQFSAHDESRKISSRVTTGLRAKALAGVKVQGTRLFGYERQLLDERGNVIASIDCQTKFRKPPGTKCVLIPSAAEAEAIRWGYGHVLDGGSPAHVAAEFNRRGLRTKYGADWEYTTVKRLLANPTYCGQVVSGRVATGKFSTVEGPIVSDGKHESIIDQQTFNAVQRVLKARSYTHPVQKGYLLSGLVKCGHCGHNQTGKCHHTNGVRFYVHDPRYYHDCGHASSVKADRLEAVVVRLWAQRILTMKVVDSLKRSATRAERASRGEQPSDRTIAAAREKLQRTERNMAFANSEDDYRALATIAAGIREELAKSAKAEADINSAIQTTEETAEALRRIIPYRSRLMGKGDIEKTIDHCFADLKIAIHETIEEIVFRRDVQSHSSVCRNWETEIREKWESKTAVMKFRAGVMLDEESNTVEIPHQSLRGRTVGAKLDAMLDFVKAAGGKAVSCGKLLKKFGTCSRSIRLMMAMGEEKGLVRREYIHPGFVYYWIGEK